MNTSRRSFLRLSALAGTAAAFGGCKSLFTGAAGEGDIGYAILRTSPKGAEATLRQSDFFIPLPTKGRRPEIWDVILAENQGARCLFPFA